MSKYDITIGPREVNAIDGLVWPIKHNGFTWGSITKSPIKLSPYWLKVDGSKATSHESLAEARDTAVTRLTKFLDGS